MHSTERRKAERFKGEIPILVGERTFLTSNCSTEGVYFETEWFFFVGEQVEFVMLLDHAGMGAGVRLRCQGAVLRVAPGGGRLGVAVSIAAHEYEKNPGTSESLGGNFSGQDDVSGGLNCFRKGGVSEGSA